MNSLMAFALGDINREKEPMVFDWEKAAQLIVDKKCSRAIAGLSEDMDYTSGSIFINGKPYFDSYTYLSSTWAIPIIEIDDEEIPCFKMQSELPEYDSDTKWPKVALDILEVSQNEN